MGLFSVTCSRGHENKKGARFCVECGEGLSSTAVRCAACNAEVAAGAKHCGRCGAKLPDPAAQSARTKPCHGCGAEIPDDARFCGKCGATQAGARVQCPKCQAVVPMADHCSRCGSRLGASQGSEITDNRWARKADDFATRVEVSDVEGTFKKGLIVEAGTKAIFFSNGAYSGILDPGKYDMGGLLQRLKNIFNSKTTTAVLMDVADVELSFELPEVVTRDPLHLKGQCRVVVQVEQPTLFFENLMKGKKHYPLTELRQYLEGEVQNAAQEFVSGRSVHELSGNIQVKRELEEAIATHLATTFERKGLSFVQVRVVNFRHERLDGIARKKEEYWLDRQEMEADAGGRAGSMDVTRRLLDQDTAEMLMQVEVKEQQIDVLARARRAIASDKMDEVRTKDQFEQFLHEQELDKTLRAGLRDDLLSEFVSNREDRDLRRSHLIQKLKLEQDAEEKRLQLLATNAAHALNDADRAERFRSIESDLAVARKRLEMAHAEEWVLAEQRRQQRVADARADIDIEREQDKLDREEAEAGIDMLARMKALKNQEASWDHERRLEQEKVRHQQELERMQTMSGMSAEALITLAPKEQAAMLAELKRTEALRGMSEEQILAMAAQNSPEVAKAFQEKYSSASLKQVMDEKERSTETLLKIVEQNAQRMQDMYNKGMDTQRDTAMAAARSGQPATNVIVPGMGSASVVQTGVDPNAGKRPVLCPNCRNTVLEGNKFCDTCGHKFFE